MKNHPIRRALSVVLSLVIVLALIPAISPTAFANMHYHGHEVNGDSVTLYYSCNTCGADYEVDASLEDYINDGWLPIIEADCTDIELNTDYCQMCFMDHVCMQCLTPIEECESFCYNCHQCWDCENDNHCRRCGQCTNEMCEDCLEADVHLCVDCHEDYSKCEGCGRCLYALMKTEEVCFNEQIRDTHCTTCDEPWICVECGYCFYHREEWFCSTCDMCLECAREAGMHCKSCVGCFDSEVELCEESGELCLDCCVEAGNHCEVCGEHVEEWCEGGKDCRHCADCAMDQSWICESCGQCVICNGLENCEDCGYCMECCLENRADAGCECLEFCPESADFENEEHMCAQCMAHFSCENDFCEFCGLCEDCCRDNAEAEGCVCGLCVEDGEFDQHVCSQCGEPTCTRGDFCDVCGLCASCCLENSEAEGCVCGICVESDEFEDAVHKCSSCGARFSCSVDFCESCGLCAYCCKDDPAEVLYHGSNTEPGTIFLQPSDRTRAVSRNNVYDRAENTVSFRVRAYDPLGSLRYQWYCTVDGGEPVKLVNDGHTIEAYDETLVLVGGAETDTLTVAVPCDACHREYSYFCVVSDGGGTVLSTSEGARLYGRHSFAWQRLDDEYHQQICVGEGCGETEGGMKKAHEIGPWRFVSYATATQGARMARSCSVCGSVSESTVTEPLGADHTAHDYVYTPVIGTNADGDPVSHAHVRLCRCGRQDGGEEAHVWGMWIVTQPATENKKGSKYHDCLLCHYRETVEIPRQTHEHLWNLHDYEAEFYRGGYSSKSHFQYCGDPDCNAVAFVEPHVYSSWSWQTESGTPNLGLKDATIKRTCEICGYVQEKIIHKDYRPLCFQNANLTAVSADNRWSSNKYTRSVTAAPPPGYYFTYWENVGQGPIKFEEYHEEVPYLGTVWKTYTKTDETIVISLDNFDADGNYLPLETIYELRANVERYDNNVILYDTNRSPVYTLTPEEDMADNGLFGAPAVKDEASLMGADHGVIWYESQTEDEYGYRTVTLHLNGYDGGAIELEDTGLPCNLHIIVDGDSDITTTGQQGILGCLTGGDVTVSSPNGSELRINVRSGKEDCYGIRTGRARQYHSDKLTLCGSVSVQINVTNTFGSSLGAAYGLYSNSWVALEEDASAEITVGSYAYDVAYDGQVLVSAAAIHADKELQLNTTGHLFIDASNVDVANGRKGLGIDAKNTLIDNVGQMEITYPANTRNAYNHAPTYDPQRFIFLASDDGMRRFVKNGVAVSVHPVRHLLVEPGYPVHFDVAEGGTLNVESVYQNAAGDYLVRPGDSLVFYTAPAPGRCNETVLVDGSFVKPGASDDGVRTKYVLEAVNGPHTVKVGNGVLFVPFASQPKLSQTDVFFGSEAYLTYRMNDVLQALRSHEQFGGSASADPKFAVQGQSGSYSGGKPLTGSQTINRVFLQYKNELSGEFENTGVSFTPSILGSVSFTDEKNAAALKTVRYRLMVLYDGMEYPSDEFTVHWTDDPNDAPEKMTAAVELYVKNGKFANGASCYEGGAWVRLDSEKPYLVYDVSGSDWFGRAMSGSDYARNRKTGDLILFAEFDYHTGILTLFGDQYHVDFDCDGEEEWYDLGGEIAAIRVPEEDTAGTLVINVQDDTWIEGDYDAFGWDAWNYGDGSLVRGQQLYAQTDLIVNENGGVRVTSKSGAVLDLDRCGSMLHESEAREYAGIRASGDISIEGDVSVQIGIGLNSLSVWWNNYGADRYGLVSEGAVTVRDTAYLRVRFTAPEGRHMIGAATGIHAAEIMLTGDSVTELDCSSDSVHDNVTCYVLSTEALSVMESAGLTVTAQGDIPIPIWVDGDILLATDDTVTVNALGSGEATNCFEYAGEMHIMAPTALKAAYRDGTEDAGLVYYLEPVLDGDFVIYHRAGSETENGLASEQYYPGVPYAVTVNTDPGVDTNNEYTGYEEKYPSHSVTVERGGAALYTRTGTPESLDVCAGDRVTYTAAEPITGYAFGGWALTSNLTPEELVIEGRSISFTMPDRDVSLHAVYTCEAFSAEPPLFVFTDSDATEGLLYWRVDTEIPSVQAVVLEYLTENENGESQWTPLYRYEDGAWQGWDMKEDMQTCTNGTTGERYYAGVSRIGRAGVSALPRTVNTDVSTTYRLYFWGNVEYYSQPFTIDPKNGVHVLLSQDAASPDLVIPADYVGTEYTVDLSRYLYADYGSMSYSVTLGDLFGPLDGGVCEASVFENGMLRFVRNGAHGPIYGIEGSACVTATDGKSGRSFRIPFDFGEIYDAEVYPLIVSGRKVSSHNKDDVLGDGTVSYDPETKTLTLENAALDELYPMPSDGGLPGAAYAVVAARDLTVRLIGENVISADASSYCHGRADHSFNGPIVGIGNAINEAWRPSLTEEDSFAITFEGPGSLSIRAGGDSGAAIHAIGDVTVNGAELTVRAGYSGLTSEDGSFIMNDGTVDIDAAQMSCVELSGRTARFTVNGGTLRLNGGTDSYAVSMSATDYQNAEYFQLYDGELLLQTKSAAWDLSSRDMYYTDWMYKALDAEGNDAHDAVEAPATIRTLDYLKFIRIYPIWVNGEQFTSEHLTVACGYGSAVYEPTTNTVALNSAKITRGVAYWWGGEMASGIYAQQPVKLSLSGFSTIDLSSRTYLDRNGRPYELLDEETENGRKLYGLYVDNVYEAADPVLDLCGAGSLTVKGVQTGIETNAVPISVNGPRLNIAGCEGGISADMTVNAGALTIAASAYGIYGTLDTAQYGPLYAYGGATRDESVLLELEETGAATDRGWGYSFPYFRLGGSEWSVAGAQVSGTAASWNDVDDAVYLLCSSAVSEADIRAAWENGSYAALPGAAVPAEKGGISAAAVDGRAMYAQNFSFSGVAEGDYKLAVCKPDHYPLITAVTVAGDTALGTLRLTLRGDVNEDGQADLADVHLLFRAASGAETASGPAADENGDGRVNNRDAILLFRRIVS